MSGNWFSDGTNQWFARTLWAAAKDLPEEEVGIEKLLQQEEMRRYLDAELDYPIILAPDGHITDGWHRILKAWALGHKTIKVKKLPYMPVPDGGPGARKMRAPHGQLAKEAEEWSNGSRNLEGFVDEPEAATPQAPVCLNLVDVDVVKHPGWPVRLPLKVHDYMMLKEQLETLPAHEETGLLGTMEDLWNSLSNYEQEMIERLLKRKP